MYVVDDYDWALTRNNLSPGFDKARLKPALSTTEPS